MKTKAIVFITATSLVALVVFLHCEFQEYSQVNIQNSVLNHEVLSSQTESKITQSMETSSASTSTDQENRINRPRYALDPYDCFFLNEENESKLHEIRNDFFSKLSGSTNNEDRLLSAMFSDIISSDSNVHQRRNERILDNLLALGERKDPLVAIEILRLCSIQTTNEQCTKSLVDSITSLHKNDSQMWLHAMLYYANTDQEHLVFEAIRGAQQATYSSSAFALTVKSYTQALEKNGVGNYVSNASAAVGFYMARAVPYTGLTNWCNDQLHEPRHAQACIDAGKIYEDVGSDLIDKHIGLAIQKIVYKAENNNKLVEAIEQRGKKLRTDMEDLTLVLNTIFTNESLLRNYIESMQTLGEFGAIGALEAEVIAYRSSPQFEECAMQ